MSIYLFIFVVKLEYYCNYSNIKNVSAQGKRRKSAKVRKECAKKTGIF